MTFRQGWSPPDNVKGTQELGTGGKKKKKKKKRYFEHSNKSRQRSTVMGPEMPEVPRKKKVYKQTGKKGPLTTH